MASPCLHGSEGPCVSPIHSMKHKVPRPCSQALPIHAKIGREWGTDYAARLRGSG